MRSQSLMRRRSFLAACGAAALVLPTAARAQTAARFRTISVDTSRLAATGGGALGARFSDLLLPQMRKVFADLLVPGDRHAPVLVARISSLYLASYAGNVGMDDFGGNDSIEGDGLVVANGQVVSTTHVLSELAPGYSGAYYTQGIDKARMESLAYQFAYWLRREMGL